MLIGIDPPEWAEKLIDHWVSIKDTELKVFVFYTDFLEAEQKTRLIGVTADSVLAEVKAGKIESGIFAAFVEEGECTIIPTPEGLESWTEKEIKAAADTAEQLSFHGKP